ncbi:MAG TPA: thiamine pyrophosphate-dependent dehydrogenase E1 component subunit alpha [Acidobacteriota bacterium]|nr:thiamine pyrophosphate-dependent dehydrogenase E1 component subunit alpha [Acidobacteriota bacterium]
MKQTRRLEEKLVELYKQGKVYGGLYSSLGQEAISTGTTYALGPDDVVAPVIRNIASVLIKGYTPKEIFCQYLARVDGPTRGKDTTLHFGDINRRTVAPISIIGPQVPIMAGVALAGKMSGKKMVALTYIGDGGTSTGDFHEGLNFASVQHLPFILVIENNQYAYSTPVNKQSNLKNLVDRAGGYNIPSALVDGNDVIAVYEETVHARELCLAGEGPFLMECVTFRRKGHAEHDDARYVPKEVLNQWIEKDPVTRYTKFLLSEGIITESDIGSMEQSIEAQLEQARNEALESPFPSSSDASTDVFAE